MATSKQIDFIAALASQKGYKSAREAAVAYGFDAAVSFEYMSNYDASGLIDWLKAPAKTDEQISAEMEAARVRAEEKSLRAAERRAAQNEWAASADARASTLARSKEILVERGLGHLTGKAKQQALYEIGAALKSGEIA